MHLISPSLLSADQGNVAQAVTMLSESKADWIHFDVMDGLFVPNISFGFPLLQAVRKITTKTLDVHLMVVEPERYIDRFRDAGADVLTVHYEASRHLHRTIEAVKSAGMMAGVALNPHTSVELLVDILSVADMVLIMSVNPGFGGQKFIDQTFNKIERLVNLKAKYRPDLLIQVDGGVDLSNKQSLIDAGANVLVAGNAVFSAPNPLAVIAELKSR